MTPEQYCRIEDIFREAFQRPDDQRASVVSACEDTEVREVVEELLRDREASRFLALGLDAARPQPAAHAGPSADCGVATADSPRPADLSVEFGDDDFETEASNEPGVFSSFGSFEVLEVLDESSDTRTFRALRTDGPLKRAAVIKFYACPDPQRRLARFERDRVILSAAEHPNLARLWEATVRAGGVALAWEYTGSGRLSDGAMGLGTTLRARLRGFLEVARAVEFLHFHFVAHGDIRFETIGLDASGRCKLLYVGETILNAPGGGTTYTAGDDIRQLGELLTRLAGPKRGLPGGLARIAARATDPDPSKCYTSVSQMIESVEAWNHRSTSLRSRGLRWIPWIVGLIVLVAASIWAAAKFGGSF